jgi:hypothetical protein
MSRGTAVDLTGSFNSMAVMSIRSWLLVPLRMETFLAGNAMQCNTDAVAVAKVVEHQMVIYLDG